MIAVAHRARVIVASIPLIALAPSYVSHAHAPSVQGEITTLTQESGTTSRLIAVSAPTQAVAWASGDHGTFVRTTDGGMTWKPGQVAGGDKLDFRDVHAIDANNAYLLSAGNGSSSRIYKTTDGGTTWRLQFTNKDTLAFYDCFDFWDDTHGIVVGDAVNGELAILSTSDGLNWSKIPPATFPPALADEGSFASSGTCIQAMKGGRAWIATTKGRVLRTSDFGKSWQIALTPIATGPDTPGPDSLGVSSLSFRDAKNGLAFGGFGSVPNGTAVAITADGGATWKALPRPTFPGGIFAGAFVTSALQPTVVAVGPSGSSYSRDFGATWVELDKNSYWGLGFAPGNRGWAVGPRGRITRLTGF